MPYARAAVKLIVDTPRADGAIETRGLGRNWDATEVRNTVAPGHRTPDVGGQYGWYYNGLCEYIQGLNCIAPILTYARADMDISRWTPVRGLWRESATSGSLRVKHLEYRDGRAGRYAANAHGLITSLDDWAPNLRLDIWRMPANPLETEPGIVEIILEGATAGDQYCLGLPTEGDAGDYGTAQGRTGWQSEPYLLGKRTGDTAWTLIDHMSLGAGTRSAKAGRSAELMALRIEYINGSLLVRGDDRGEPWVFSGNWWHSTEYVEFALADTGKVSLGVSGHPALIGMWALQAPASVEITPSVSLRRDTTTGLEETATPTYRTVSYVPTGTTLTVAADQIDADSCRPKVTMTSSVAGKRAALYTVQEHRAAVIGAPVHNPIELTAGLEGFRTMAVSGQIDRSYQGSRMSLEYVALPGYELSEIKPNAKITAQVGARDQAGTLVWCDTFCGYALPPAKSRSGGKSSGAIDCVDLVEARLRRKAMGWHCCYDGWPIDEWFEAVLNRAGVASTLLDIDAGISLAAMGDLYYLPSGDNGSHALQPQPGQQVPDHLDEGCKVRDLEWGVSLGGRPFLRPRPTHVAGHYDIEVDEAATDDLLIMDFRHTRSLGDFANLLHVMVGEGVHAAERIMMDTASISQPTSARYIGDIWERYEAYPGGDDLDSIAARLWDEISHMDSVISWREHNRPTVVPGMEAIVYVDSDLNIPQGSIYRITSKRWSLDSLTGRYEQELTAELVEAGTA